MICSTGKTGLYKSSINCELPPLPKEDAATFIMMRFKDSGKECPFEIAARITDRTQCYPYYIQRLSYAVFEVSGNEEDITEAHYITGLEKMLTEEGVMFASMEKSLPAGQKGLLKAFALERTDKPFAVSYIRTHRLGSLSSIQNGVKKLNLLYYIEKDEKGMYKLTDPLFELWLSRSKDTPYDTDFTITGQKEKPAAQSLKQINVQKVFQRGIEEINGYRSDQFTPIKGVLPEEKSDKPRVTIFFSYAHDDGKVKNKFSSLIRNRLKTSKKYSFNFSVDTDVLAGDDWHEKIRKMVKECDFGLLLVSTHFLKSDYISDHELPQLMNKCIPIALNIIDLKHQDLMGLEEKQIFRYNGKSFIELKEPNLTKFINQLAVQIEKRIDSALQPPLSQRAESKPDERPYETLGRLLPEQYREGYMAREFVHTKGIRGA